MKPLPIQIPKDALESLCRRYHVQELALFGSVLSSDFNTQSDIDVLVTFAPNSPLDLFDLSEMRRDLEHFFGRPVDLIEKSALKNPFRKKHILQTMEVIYAA